MDFIGISLQIDWNNENNEIKGKAVPLKLLAILMCLYNSISALSLNYVLSNFLWDIQSTYGLQWFKEPDHCSENSYGHNVVSISPVLRKFVLQFQEPSFTTSELNVVCRCEVTWPPVSAYQRNSNQRGIVLFKVLPIKFH